MEGGFFHLRNLAGEGLIHSLMYIASYTDREKMENQLLQLLSKRRSDCYINYVYINLIYTFSY